MTEVWIYTFIHVQPLNFHIQIMLMNARTFETTLNIFLIFCLNNTKIAAMLTQMTDEYLLKDKTPKIAKQKGVELSLNSKYVKNRQGE